MTACGASARGICDLCPPLSLLAPVCADTAVPTVSSPSAARFASNEENPAAGGHTAPCLLRASRSSSASMESR